MVMSQIKLAKVGVLGVGVMALIGLDQWLKMLLSVWSATGLHWGIIKFVEYKNPGIAFSIPLLSMVALCLISGLLLVLIWLFLSSQRSWIYQLGLLLAIGGGISNLWDRVHFGWVRDFISIGWLPIFNLADIFIFVGVILIIVGVSYGGYSQKI